MQTPLKFVQLPGVSSNPGRFKLRVLPGLYNERLKPEATESFYSDTWTVGTEANRMGYRLKGGDPLPFKERTPPSGAGSDPSNIVDAGYAYGSIQVPEGLEPIILHRDAVSGGGYAMIGTSSARTWTASHRCSPTTRSASRRLTWARPWRRGPRTRSGWTSCAQRLPTDWLRKSSTLFSAN